MAQDQVSALTLGEEIQTMREWRHSKNAAPQDVLRRTLRSLTGGAKRRGSSDPLQSWYPYYAGYSAEFAGAVLTAVSLPKGAVVLDPWNGSGTTTLVAHRLGFTGVGVDLNPVAEIVATAKLVSRADVARAQTFIRKISKPEQFNTRDVLPTDPLLNWLPRATTQAYRRLEQAISRETQKDRSMLQSQSSVKEISPFGAFLRLALMRAAREVASIRHGSNPTWITPGKHTRKGSTQLLKRWQSHVEAMSLDIAPETQASPSKTSIITADARELPLAESSVDFVLTSPPYCTRIDYVKATGFELAALGLGANGETYTQFRRTLMGAPLVRESARKQPPDDWPTSVKQLLEAIESHHSKASKSYYYKTYWQYFDDLSRALKSILRVLKLHGQAVIVVQSSYYKEVRVDLPSLGLDMARQVGFTGNLILETQVRSVISKIHPSVKNHRKSGDYRESVLLLERNNRT